VAAKVAQLKMNPVQFLKKDLKQNDNKFTPDGNFPCASALVGKLYWDSRAGSFFFCFFFRSSFIMNLPGKNT
jgi:hypothetical protein